MLALPTGTVTFLFTDIEGSTALWQQHPEVMSDVIARHDMILKEIVARHGGVVFRTVGDAVYASFTTPGDALSAALAIQRALDAELWEQGIRIRVRMGIHTGAVELRDGEYTGHTLNRVARLVSSGHGGQMLLSAASAGLVRDALPPDVTLRDLGEHRLKDLVLPERIYGVHAPDLASDFPPLRTLDQPRTNLPAQRGALVGREEEMESARRLLQRDDVGLVTFTGAGGAGKTSLAVATGHALLDRFPDGVWFVSLAPISEPALVPSAIMAALGLREEGDKAPMEILRDFLAPKQLLLILDNLEQVVSAAPLLAELLRGAPRLTMLGTSRVALRLGDEHELPIAPLSVPGRDQLRHLESISQYAAVQLFVARARQVKPSFAVTDENALAVAEICARLDGLPLAIELAAARIRVLTPQALLGRLDRQLPLLRGGAHDLPTRQQTMESTIAWSYDLLTPEEQTLYRQLAVFSGSFTLDAAEAVCGDGETDLLDGLTSMVDKSLVRQDDSGAEPRFSMLQVIREYGLARLEESGESEQLHRRYAAFFAGLSETLEQRAYAAGPSVVFASLEAEWDNLRGALDWSLSEWGDAQLAMRLVATLGHFFLFSDHGPEGRVRTEALFARSSEQERDEAWAAARISSGVLALQRGDYAEGLAELHESQNILEGTDNLLRQSLILNWLGIVAMNMGDAQRAERIFTENREMCLSLGFPWGATVALASIAENLGAQGRLDDADTRAVQAAAAFRDLHDPWGMGRMGVLRASVAWLRGDYGAAHRHAAEAVELSRQSPEPYNLGRAVTLFGIILVDEGRCEEADPILRESLLIWKTLSNRGAMIIALAGLTATAACRGQIERARYLYAAEPFRREDRGLLLDGVLDIGFDHFITCIRERLGNVPDDGPEIALEVAVSFALEA
jgi:predicted ATPase/class 3 adenylate cyclase